MGKTYRKKPAEIEAMLFDGTPDIFAETYEEA